jgi:uncharacterized membrane protein
LDHWHRLRAVDADPGNLIDLGAGRHAGRRPDRSASSGSWRQNRPQHPPNRYPHPSAGPKPGPHAPRRVHRAERSAALLVGIGGVVALAFGLLGAWSYALIGAWGAVSVTYLVGVWWHIRRLDGRQTADHATADDPGRRTMDLMLVIAALVSLADVIYVLAGSGASADGPAGADVLHAIGGFVSVALSWAVIHTLFTLRYARLYHQRGCGIEFHSDRLPSYLDFAYVAFTVGMTYQISDTDITRHRIRRDVLRHALLSYLFGTVILAAAVNLVMRLV